MNIVFTNRELEDCWGGNSNTHLQNLNALIPTDDDCMYNGELSIKKVLNGCAVQLDYQIIDDVLNDSIAKQYREVAEKILTWDEIRGNKTKRSLNIGDSGVIKLSEEDDEEEYVEHIEYGKCQYISKSTIIEEHKQFVRRFKNTILTNNLSTSSCIHGKRYNATADASILLNEFANICVIYNAQRIVDCLRDLDELGVELSEGYDWHYEEVHADKKKYVLMWFKAYDVIRKLYLDFANNALCSKFQKHYDSPYDKVIEIYNISIDKWMDVERMHDELWDWILHSIGDTNEVEIEQARAKNAKAYDRWSAQDSLRLLAMYHKGISVSSIARTFERSTTSVIVQLGELLTNELKGR